MLGAARSRCNVRVYGAGDNSKRITRGSQFSTMKQEKDRKARKAASDDAAYARKKTYIRYSRHRQSMQYPALCKWPRNLAFSTPQAT